MTASERVPLLHDSSLVNDQRFCEDADKDIVDFDIGGDAENPMDWPSAYKWGIVALLAFMAFTTYEIEL
jgi:hypothetical protein